MERETWKNYGMLQCKDNQIFLIIMIQHQQFLYTTGSYAKWQNLKYIYINYKVKVEVIQIQN